MKKRIWTLIISGRPISKKNSKRIALRGSKRILLPSVAYERFARNAGQQIMILGKHPYFTIPVRVECQFYLKGKIDADGDNLFTSILDVLADNFVLKNDNLVVEGQWKKIAGNKDFETAITVTEV